MDQLKAEMEKLQEKMMHAEIMRKAKEEELVRLQSNLHPDFTQINDWELAFGKLAATPFVPVQPDEPGPHPKGFTLISKDKKVAYPKPFAAVFPSNPMNPDPIRRASP
ncbi:hypothetical protein HanHA300_Chr16g0623021 [Helianthus annuus]|nr:hypothetical protein HanHA300_Chr16g0623021 [Helianthus annuus]KAJ0444280.1 hypothetical protein HanIR_Chr16g0830101 [Helianthus annuus]KAJ0461578.1 hypothetical protein HanHA89_Chr16g0673871 [Helianthus annuus]